MTISFTTYPASNRIPGVYAEIDNSQANTAIAQQRSLLIGQMLAAGTATANVPVLATSAVDVRTATGPDSMLALMYNQYRKSDPFGEAYILPVADNGSGVAGTTTVTFTGTSTAAGVVNLYVGGVNVTTPIASGTAAAAVATAVAAAVNANIDLPVTAGAASAVVTLTSKHKGIAAADVDVRVNYGGAANGEVTPAGLTVAIAAGVAGTLDPVIDTALANLGSTTFDFICTPYTATTQVTSIANLLSDTSGRWSYLSELFGGAFSAKRGTASALTTFGTALNNQHLSVLGFNDMPAPLYVVAAEYTAQAAVSLRADPGVPLQNVILNLQAPPISSRFIQSERNTLLYSGVSTFKVNDAGQVILERAVTTYRTNAQGVADSSYLDVETLYCLQSVIRELRRILESKFGRKKLVTDGTVVPGGSNFVTSKHVLGEVVAWYREAAADGLVQDATGFTRTARAENVGNGRVSLFLPINVPNQLRQVTMLVQFLKS